jgi:hypothetical protein
MYNPSEDSYEIYEDENVSRGRIRHPPGLNSPSSLVDTPHFISYPSPKSQYGSVEIHDPEPVDDWTNFEDGLKTPVPSQRMAFYSDTAV